MGCCCTEPPIVNAPNEQPDPPPTCDFAKTSSFITKYHWDFQRRNSPFATGFLFNDWVVSLNDEVWPDFVSSSWKKNPFGFGGTIGFSDDRHTALAAPSFTAGLFWDLTLTENAFVGYHESRYYILIPLIHTYGGQHLSLREMYGITGGQIDMAGTLYAGSPIAAIGAAVAQATDVGEHFAAWSTWDVHWGFVGSEDLVLFTTPIEEVLADTPITIIRRGATVSESIIANGLTDVASNTLQSGLTVPDATTLDVVIPGSPIDSVESAVGIDISSIVDESGGDFLLILIKVPDAAVEKKTPTTAATIELVNGGLAAWHQWHGPAANVQTNTDRWRETFTADDFPVERIWGCIMSINLNIDVDANASNLIEEDRNSLATYLSGTGTSKKFRSTDKSTASFGTCNLVPISRIYSADNPIENWTLTFTDACHEALLESILTSVDMMHDDSLAGCHWTASESHTNCTVTLACPMFLWPWFIGVAPVNVTATVSWDLSITNAGSGNVDMLLTVTLSFSPDPGDPSHAVSYSLAGQAATSTGPFTLTATVNEAGRTYNPAGGTDEIVFPETIELTTSSTPTDVTRICDIYLTEVGNDWFLNFDYHRASNPNSENYYIEKDAFQVEVGPGTAYETLGDIENVRFSFDHPGSANETTANGTEDATIAFTILSFNQGGLFQSGFVG